MTKYQKCTFCGRAGHPIGWVAVCMYCARGSTIERESDGVLMLVRQGGVSAGKRVGLADEAKAPAGATLAGRLHELAAIAECSVCRASLL